MKAVGYWAPKPISEPDSLVDLEVEKPQIGEMDLLVNVRAVSVNPVDYKIRRSRKPPEGQPAIIGWDAAGVVEAMGGKVSGFAVGDEVYYAGNINRQGSDAEYQAVDHRLVGHKPHTLSFAEAAALPLTSLTAYEALFEHLRIPATGDFAVLIIGGAGGVGSTAVQLVKALTQGRVYATYGREESKAWLTTLGVDGLIDRKQSLMEGMQSLGLPYFDYVFSTTHTGDYLTQITTVLRPFGGLCLIDDPKTLDITHLKSKALSVAWEFMFAKSMHGYNEASQGAILNEIASLVDEGRIRSTASTNLKGLSAETLKQAHRLSEEETAIGKIVIEF